MKRSNERYICIGLSCHTWVILSHKLWSLHFLSNCKILLHTLDWMDGTICDGSNFFWLIGVHNMIVMESFWVSVRSLFMVNNNNFEIKYTEWCLYPFSMKIGKSAFFDAKKSENCKQGSQFDDYTIILPASIDPFRLGIRTIRIIWSIH